MGKKIIYQIRQLPEQPTRDTLIAITKSKLKILIYTRQQMGLGTEISEDMLKILETMSN